MRSPILITGAPRSGTSMTAGIIAQSGAFGGRTVGASGVNKKGMFENITIRNSIVKPFLAGIGADPRCQTDLPDTLGMEIPRNWGRRIEGALLSHGYTGGPWYYKDPKMVWMWPVWHYAYPDAKWILVRRDRASIAESMLNTPFMTAYADQEGWEGYVKLHEDRFEEMKAHRLNIMELYTPELIKGDMSQLEHILKWIGLDFNEGLVKQFVDPNLWQF